ncbi:hypothetical protein V5P93_000485 [Actinokineospora auranticolor]|uniref:CU044_5270 family protein n=1 Tax=Actinokineospora auranticolor TaxID=155976 RepID=A0A2S6GZH5_9PSEU|nr:hypothetical protein [Actinokineospora auranticolor]PPK70634.1 hypothetical protein CLV40_102552 [Actinokineospora auranticolor]
MTDEDLDLLLADLNADVPDMTDDAYNAGLARLVGRTGSAEDLEPAQPTPRPVLVPASPHADRSPPRRRRVWTVAAAAAAVAAVSAGVIYAVGDNHGQTTPSGTVPTDSPVGSSAPHTPAPTSRAPIRDVTDVAPTTLAVVGSTPTHYAMAPMRFGPIGPMPNHPVNNAGDLAAVVSDLEIPPGAFRFEFSGAWQNGKLTHGVYHWYSSDPAGDWGTQDAPKAGQPAPALRLVKPDSSGRELQQQRLDAIPDDPAGYYEQLRQQFTGKPSGQANAVQTMSGLLYGDAKARATIFRTLGYFDSVTVRTDQRNPDGRIATAITVNDGHIYLELYIDPATGRLIGRRSSELGPAREVTTEALVPTMGAFPK